MPCTYAWKKDPIIKKIAHSKNVYVYVSRVYHSQNFKHFIFSISIQFSDDNCCYHCGGWSEEVNSCILILSYMVYLLPKHSLGYQQHLYRAIIIYIHMYNWQSFRHLHTIIMYTFSLIIHVALSPCSFSPYWFPFAPLSQSPLLTWNPPCCDRIRLPWSQVAHKLISSFPSLPIYSPSVLHSEIPTPLGFPRVNAPPY
jgi:hypothetical protein